MTKSTDDEKKQKSVRSWNVRVGAAMPFRRTRMAAWRQLPNGCTLTEASSVRLALILEQITTMILEEAHKIAATKDTKAHNTTIHSSHIVKALEKDAELYRVIGNINVVGNMWRIEGYANDDMLSRMRNRSKKLQSSVLSKADES